MRESVDGQKGSEGLSGRGLRFGTAMWVSYLTVGATLAVTRVALLVWLNHRRVTHTSTSTDTFIFGWMYPEVAVSVFWRSLLAFGGTEYYAVWGSLIIVGSFVLAIPVLFVRWLIKRSLMVQLAFCASTIPAVTGLLLMIIRIFDLDE